MRRWCFAELLHITSIALRENEEGFRMSCL